MGGRARQPTWGERDERQRVLIENPDFGVGFAVERVLEDAGYEVAVCGGPDSLAGHECPLVFTGECDLVSGADLVVHSLNPDRREHAEVLRALRAMHPKTPIVVEVAGPSAAHHEGLLHGCVVIPFPATRESLVGAVAEALAER
jgi:hypothetical protein